MTNHSLLINYADSDAESTVSCKYWCRLAVDGADEKLTVAAAAKMVDDLYNRNPCVPAGDQEPVPDAEATDIEDAGKVLNVDLCAQLKSGDYTTKIRVIKSHPDTPHTSVIVGPGTIKSTVPTEAMVTYVVDVETAESATLLYPVVENDFEAVWTGISGPEIKRHCEELTWEGVTTGRLTITHPTKYDLVTVEVPGVPNYEGSDRGEPQEFELLVFYNHQAYKEQFESPLDYDSISEVCGWYSSSVTIPEDPENPYPEPPPEPEDPCQETVMDRYNTSYKPGTQPFDSNKCCDAPPKMGSDCMVMKVGTVQSKEMTPEAKAYYESLGNYCYAGLCTPVSAVEFKAVGPAPGETCGDILNETVVQQRNCCDLVEPVYFDRDQSSAILPHNGSALLIVAEGRPPYTFTTSNQHTFFDPNTHIRHITTNVPVVRIWSDQYFCGTTRIRVTDTCNYEDSYGIMSDMGSWLSRPDLHCVFEGAEADSYIMNPGNIYWRSKLDKEGFRIWQDQYIAQPAAPPDWTDDSIIGVGMHPVYHCSYYYCCAPGASMQEAVAYTLTMKPGTQTWSRPCLAAHVPSDIGSIYNPFVDLRETGIYKDWGIYRYSSSEFYCNFIRYDDYYSLQYVGKGPATQIWEWVC